MALLPVCLHVWIPLSFLSQRHAPMDSGPTTVQQDLVCPDPHLRVWGVMNWGGHYSPHYGYLDGKSHFPSSWSKKGDRVPAQANSVSVPMPSVTTPSCLSVVSICGIESEFYYLQIAGHKPPNSISGSKALEISFLPIQALREQCVFTFPSRSLGLVFQRTARGFGEHTVQSTLSSHFWENCLLN